MSKESSDHEAVDGEIISESSPEISSAQADSQSDHNASADTDSASSPTELKTRLLSPEHWLRGLFMVLFVLIACVASYVMVVLVVIQFLFALVTGASEERLRTFGLQLSQYLFQILTFVTYNDEQKPFPFNDWPDDTPSQ